MGIKDLFSSSGRSQKRLEKLIRNTANPYTQSAERYHSMEQLLADGSVEALAGMFERFTVTSTKGIEDEEEKGWAYRKLSELGPKVLPAVKRYCLRELPSVGGRQHNIAWALRVVEDVADADQEWDLVEALLERHPPEYSRDVASKTQMLTHIADIDDERVPEILLRYLSDPDENVRFFIIEALTDIGDPRIREPFIERLAPDKEDSVRLRTKILDGLAALKFDVSEHTDALAAAIGNEHEIRGGKVVRR